MDGPTPFESLVAPEFVVQVVPFLVTADGPLSPSSRRAYSMGMPNLARRWTREEVLALPDDGNRYDHRRRAAGDPEPPGAPPAGGLGAV
jgi:hypothetical protein